MIANNRSTMISLPTPLLQNQNTRNNCMKSAMCLYAQAKSLPGSTVRVALLLVTDPDRERSTHCTVVPLFNIEDRTERIDNMVPVDEFTLEEIPRSVMLLSVASTPSTVHTILTPAPAHLNTAVSPTSALTDTGPSVSAGEKLKLQLAHVFLLLTYN